MYIGNLVNSLVEKYASNNVKDRFESFKLRHELFEYKDTRLEFIRLDDGNLSVKRYSNITQEQLNKNSTITIITFSENDLIFRRR